MQAGADKKSAHEASQVIFATKKHTQEAISELTVMY